MCDFIYGKEVSLEKLVDLGGEVLLDKESNEDIYEDVHVFKPKFNSISEVYEELKDKKLNLDKTIDCAAPHYMSNILGNPVVEVLYNGSEIYIDEVMYCPECDKEHRNGEEFCTDCGTELVTKLKFYMMVEYGDY